MSKCKPLPLVLVLIFAACSTSGNNSTKGKNGLPVKGRGTALTAEEVEKQKDAERQVQGYRWGVGFSIQQAVAKYPSLGRKDSKLNRLFVARVKQLKKTNPRYFASFEWPMDLADDCARKLPTEQLISSGPTIVGSPPTDQQFQDQPVRAAAVTAPTRSTQSSTNEPGYGKIIVNAAIEELVKLGVDAFIDYITH